MAEYCVTGGTGLIAAYLVKALLDKGHTVRTTVRDPGMCCKIDVQSMPEASPLIYIQHFLLSFRRGCEKGGLSLGVEWSQGEA